MQQHPTFSRTLKPSPAWWCEIKIVQSGGKFTLPLPLFFPKKHVEEEGKGGGREQNVQPRMKAPSLSSSLLKHFSYGYLNHAAIASNEWITTKKVM
jgi:hypothetical protein